MMKKLDYQVKHILVQHRYEAEDLLHKLKDGQSFEDLALKFSQCPSAKAGGDLGVLKFGQADSDFEDAVSQLKTGEVSRAAVQTRFGYHLLFRLK
jgi:peptidyl-prolyl cis-trans isomerase C